jgi:hypothetical protein
MKPWYRSKTVWFNGLTIVVAVASFFGWTPDPHLTEIAARTLVAVSPAVNLVLRFFTRRPVAANSL